MSTPTNEQMTDVVTTIEDWPPESRVRLARRVLESVDASQVPVPQALELKKMLDAVSRTLFEITARPRALTSAELISLLNPPPTVPDDEECQSILEEELIRKHLP